MQTIDSVRLRFGLRVAMLARRWRQRLDASLASLPLSDATWTPLMHLHEMGDGVSQSELAAAVGLDGSSLVRLLDILAGHGLVERHACTQDRRVKRLHLTAAGRRMVKKIRGRLDEVEQELLADLTDAEISAFVDAIDRIDRRIATMESRGRTEDA